MIKLRSTQHNDSSFNKLRCYICSKMFDIKKRVDCEGPRSTFCFKCYDLTISSTKPIGELRDEYLMKNEAKKSA